MDAAFAVVNRFHGVAFGLQVLSNKLAEADIVVNYKDVFHWLFLCQIERHKATPRQARKILHESPIFVRKEVSIAKFTELTKLNTPLTDSLRPVSIQSTFSPRNLCVPLRLCGLFVFAQIHRRDAEERRDYRR